MSTVDLRAERQAWTLDDWAAPHPLQRWLPGLAGVCLLLVDMMSVLGAFLVAHWVRFVLARDEPAAVGLENYVHMALTVTLISVVLLAVHGLYDEERRPTWPKRLNAILSAVSTALVLAIVVW